LLVLGAMGIARANWPAWLAAGAMLISSGGCRLLGIDNRAGIEYVTAKEIRHPKEPMYARPVPGTNLIKRWPQRLGVDYGYAPWEKAGEVDEHHPPPAAPGPQVQVFDATGRVVAGGPSDQYLPPLPVSDAGGHAAPAPAAAPLP
jgi:hypothetical protein